MLLLRQKSFGLCIPRLKTPQSLLPYSSFFFSRDRNYGIPRGPFTHMHHLLYSCWGFLQLYLGQFSVLQFLPIQTFMVYMKQRLHQLVPKILPYQVIYHTIDRRNTSCLVTSPQSSIFYILTQYHVLVRVIFSKIAYLINHIIYPSNHIV